MAVTENWAEAPPATDRFCGWPMMFGARAESSRRTRRKVLHIVGRGVAVDLRGPRHTGTGVDRVAVGVHAVEFPEAQEGGVGLQCAAAEHPPAGAMTLVSITQSI